MNSFKFSNGQQAHDIRGLLNLSLENKEEASWHLREGHFEPWLSDIGRTDLAEEAKESRRVSDDKFSGLANFLLGCFIQELKRVSKRPFSLLLMGQTGVGKSSTVNSLLGKDVAPVNDYKPQTRTVELFKNTINGIDLLIYDTPGLCDDLQENANDQKYLSEIRNKVSHVDALWFVSRLDFTRVSNDEKRAIKLITEAFGDKVWGVSIVVFTFSGSINREKFPLVLRERSQLIRDEIGKYIGSLSGDIPTVAVDNKNNKTPDDIEWLNELYTKMFVRISSNGTIPFLMLTENQVTPIDGQNTPPKIDLSDKQKGTIREKILEAIKNIVNFLKLAELISKLPKITEDLGWIMRFF